MSNAEVSQVVSPQQWGQPNSPREPSLALHQALESLEQDLSALRFTATPDKYMSENDENDDDDDDCQTELLQLGSFSESIRQELSLAEDSWRQSERDSMSSKNSCNDKKQEPLSPEQPQPVANVWSNVPDLTLSPKTSGEESSEASSTSSSTEEEEARTASSVQENPMEWLRRSSTTTEGGAMMSSLALASDVLASQLYAPSQLLPCWLHTHLPSVADADHIRNWLWGVPLLGSGGSDGKVCFMSTGRSENDTLPSCEDSLDDIRQEDLPPLS